MSIYRYECDSDRFSSLRVGRQDRKSLDRFDGRPLAPRWRPLRLQWQRGPEDGDFPRLSGHVPVFSDRAWNALEPLVGPHVEHLPIAHDAPDLGPFAAIHVLPILDCLDASRADVHIVEGTIISIRHYAFVPERIAAFPMFRIKGFEYGNLFVDGRFRQAVEAGGLRGLIFDPLP